MNVLFDYLVCTKKKYPNKIAIKCNDKEITFDELYKCSLSLSKMLVAREIVNKPILIYLPKNEQSIIAMMGILASGNFYTPTDVKSPLEKSKRVCEVLKPVAVITNRDNVNKCYRLGFTKEEIIIIDEVKYEDDLNLIYIQNAISEDLAYVLFTSGSTGTPKGVMITRGAVVDYIEWVGKCFDITENDSICNQAPFYFDNSTLDIYLMLSRGVTMHIVPDSYYTFPGKLIQYLIENKITAIFWVPSVFQTIQRFDLLSKSDNLSLKKILFAGEVMHNRELNYWRSRVKDAVFANLYGPTEITVDCTYYIVDKDYSDDEALPIGIPRSNMDVFLVNEDGKKVEKPNERGEICVRGYSLSKGYWNDPIRTKEVFVQNPFVDYSEERIYKTGDIGHYNEEMNIMFDGRNDYQIKHLGCRIELGEVDNMSLLVPYLQQVCNLYDAKKDRIILFATVKEKVKEEEIIKELRNILPAYMMPEKVVIVDEFPLNDNGKYDRQKLAVMIEERNL